MDDVLLLFLLIVQALHAYKSGLWICLRGPALFVLRANLRHLPTGVMQMNVAKRVVTHGQGICQPVMRIFLKS